jgi:hypothetical protein
VTALENLEILVEESLHLLELLLLANQLFSVVGRVHEMVDYGFLRLG